jgi:hypothetical protein
VGEGGPISYLLTPHPPDYIENERVEFEDGWFVKSCFITKDEMKTCELTRTKFKPKKKRILLKFLMLLKY